MNLDDALKLLQAMRRDDPTEPVFVLRGSSSIAHELVDRYAETTRLMARTDDEFHESAAALIDARDMREWGEVKRRAVEAARLEREEQKAKEAAQLG